MSADAWVLRLPTPDDWGTYDRVSEERRADLDALEDRQRAWAERPEATRGDPPLAGVPLTGAEVFYLAARAFAGPDGDLARATARLRDPVADLRIDPVASPRVRRSALDASFDALHLERANLAEARLTHAILNEAHLEGAYLRGAYLEAAYLRGAHLEGADLIGAHLDAANLGPLAVDRRQSGAHLERAELAGASLRRAQLIGVYLQGAGLLQARLEGAVLAYARLDEDTLLAEIVLGPGAWGDWLDRLQHRNRNAELRDVRWHDADLTAVYWDRVRRLGDEWYARPLGLARSHRDAVRAYRQVAAQLYAQGLNEVADRFAERAQIRARKQIYHQLLGDWRRPWRFLADGPRWLFSWFLALLAGYGFHPVRSVAWYVVTIVGFAVAYYHLGPAAGHTFQPDGALVFSVTSFHGRGFFPGGLDVESTVTKLAAMESVIGLLIEISFIATFTQRFFGAK